MKATAKLRQLLREPGIIVAPGAYDCLTAKLIERQGFPAESEPRWSERPGQARR